MKKSLLVLMFLTTLFLSSCIDLKSLETKQVYPSNDLSKVKKLKIYRYDSRDSKPVTDSLKINWYANFFKDSSNYYKKESIDKEKGGKATHRISFISEQDTLVLSIYPAQSPNKIVAGFLDPYDPNDPWKFRRFNQFYINDQILDSLKAHW